MPTPQHASLLRCTFPVSLRLVFASMPRNLCELNAVRTHLFSSFGEYFRCLSVHVSFVTVTFVASRCSVSGWWPRVFINIVVYPLITDSLRARGSGIEPRLGRDIPQPSTPALGPTQFSMQWVSGPFPGG